MEKQKTTHMGLMHVTENYAKYTFQAPCCCSESGLTMHLLLVETIDVSID